jgi:GxxExxY protein
MLTTNHTNQHEQKQGLIYKDECYGIYNCIYTVNKKLGTGFLEAVYQEALEIELKRENIPFKSQHELEILYDGVPLTKKIYCRHCLL